ncbi:MAG TPA: type II toxin-antitoxin system VapC family toxin [Geminicoccaceae bacterium]|nr:type II toxin-antitoxin system VapC family toxin [Geminicoccus sp.]HMU48725.1 type II toxin-antitoxin system VapC family toxin [Geminicoccaceae bacterium]
MARFLIDTNVLSEARRKRADAGVMTWIRATPPQDMAISVMVIGEILKGILSIEAREPEHAASLRDWLSDIEATHLILPVDEMVIREWARLRIMFPIRSELEDMLIAATALAHRLTVVTRNIRDFAEFGVPVLDPWQAG